MRQKNWGHPGEPRSPSSSPSSGQGKAEGPDAITLSVDESKGHTVGKGCSGTESVSVVLTVCHQALFLFLLRRACSCQQKSRQSSGVYLQGFLREGKKCSCVVYIQKPGQLKVNHFKRVLDIVSKSKESKTNFQMSTFLLDVEMKELTQSKTQLKVAALQVQKRNLSLSLRKSLVFQARVASAVLFIDHCGTFWKQLLQTVSFPG